MDNTFFIPLEEGHLEVLRIERNKEDVRMNFSNARLLSQADQKEWYTKISLDKTKKYFVIGKDNEFAGSVWFEELDFINRSCRVGIFLVDKYRKQGIATFILGEFIRHLSDTLGVHRIWLLVLEENISAIKLYEKLGFKREGIQTDAIYRNKKWHNYIMMGRIENE
jgi:diamine N-acetyltransferase